MTIAGYLKKDIEIPKGVTVKVNDLTIVVKGKKVETSRTFDHKKISMNVNGDKVHLEVELPRKKDKAMIGTYAGHIANMIKGVSEGFTYEMKIVYNHFPMKVAVKGKEVVIENFLGESFPRRANILGDTKVKVKGEMVTLTGSNKEHVGQTAANVEKATRITRVDPRVFQDGVYIVTKG